MPWLDRTLARLVRDRGPAALWQLATLAAIAPYIIAPALSLPASGNVPIWALAMSLAVSLTLLSCLRLALDQLQLGPVAPIAITEDATLAPVVSERNDAKGELLDTIGAHAPVDGPAAVGMLRFSNFPAMAAFSAVIAHHVLDAFEKRLKAATGAKRPSARMDSHSFCIWFADGAEDAAAELSAIAHALSQEIAHDDVVVAPDIHVGVVRLDGAGEPPLATIARVQAALVPLKRFMQAQAPANTASVAVPLSERFALEQSLRRAVRNGQLFLHYQPFVDVAAGRVCGAEALLRWRHPELGNVSPVRFVPLLEETGLIHEIGLWTLNTACRQLSIWRTSGATDLRLAVNLSAVQLQNRSLGSLIERTVAAHGLAPSDIELELTETAAMEDRELTGAVFSDLRTAGFGIAIDDFGSGHSNLSYLKNLPFTKLKIDRDFVTDVDARAGSRAICKALVELADGLGISVLAEGVERVQEVHTLHRLGCDVFQGFYFSRGMAADDLTMRLADREWLGLIASTVHRQRAEIQKRMTS